MKGKVRDKIAGCYLRGTTYLRTPLFEMIPVVTLFVVCARAVTATYRDFCQYCSGLAVTFVTLVTLILSD